MDNTYRFLELFNDFKYNIAEFYNESPSAVWCRFCEEEEKKRVLTEEELRELKEYSYIRNEITFSSKQHYNIKKEDIEHLEYLINKVYKGLDNECK